MEPSGLPPLWQKNRHIPVRIDAAVPPVPPLKKTGFQEAMASCFGHREKEVGGLFPFVNGLLHGVLLSSFCALLLSGHRGERGPNG